MSIRTFLTVILALMSNGSVGADFSCEIRSDLIGECFNAEGVITLGNGRQWIILDINGKPYNIAVVLDESPGGEGETFSAPKNVREAVNSKTPAVAGSLRVCPLSEGDNNWLPSVCIETASNLRAELTLKDFLPGLQRFFQGYVDAYSQNEVDYFYITPVSHENGRNYSKAYWMSGNAILLLTLPVDESDEPLAYDWWNNGPGMIDLSTGIVPTPEEIGSSTYLTNVQWVEEVILNSLSNGTKIVVKKNAAN